jgi:hypothetical protein
MLRPRNVSTSGTQTPASSALAMTANKASAIHTSTAPSTLAPTYIQSHTYLLWPLSLLSVRLYHQLKKLTMSTSTLAQEKDLEDPTGHPAFDEPATPLESPPIRTSPVRYYQRFPPALEAAPASAVSEDREFTFRSESPDHVKTEPTILDKVKEVLHLHKRL